MNYASKTQKACAWLCTNKNGQKNRGRVKIHQPGSKIYLKDGEEFEIELFNPTTSNLKAAIYLDNKFIGSGIIIRPGERIFLDCFPDTKKKFTFKTYEVEDSEESENATRTNGDVKIKFHKEYEVIDVNYYPPIRRYYYYDYYNQPIFGSTSGSPTLNNSGTTFTTTTLSNTDTSNTQAYSTANVSNTIETGQVEGGEKSDQDFENVNMNFNNYTENVISFKILPYSRKPLTKKDVMKKEKKVSINDHNLERLMKLSELYDKGHLTQDEFESLKSNLIK